MKHGMLAAAGLLAAALVAGAGVAQEPVKVKGDEESGKLTVKDTGEKVKVKKSGGKYKVKETGEKFKVKETHAGEKVKGTSIKIKPQRHGGAASAAERESAPRPRATPSVPPTPAGAALTPEPAERRGE